MIRVGPCCNVCGDGLTQYEWRFNVPRGQTLVTAIACDKYTTGFRAGAGGNGLTTGFRRVVIAIASFRQEERFVTGARCFP